MAMKLFANVQHFSFGHKYTQTTKTNGEKRKWSEEASLSTSMIQMINGSYNVCVCVSERKKA